MLTRLGAWVSTILVSLLMGNVVQAALQSDIRMPTQAIKTTSILLADSHTGAIRRRNNRDNDVDHTPARNVHQPEGANQAPPVNPGVAGQGGANPQAVPGLGPQIGNPVTLPPPPSSFIGNAPLPGPTTLPPPPPPLQQFPGGQPNPQQVPVLGDRHNRQNMPAQGGVNPQVVPALGPQIVNPVNRHIDRLPPPPVEAQQTGTPANLQQALDRPLPTSPIIRNTPQASVDDDGDVPVLVNQRRNLQAVPAQVGDVQIQAMPAMNLLPGADKVYDRAFGPPLRFDPNRHIAYQGPVKFGNNNIPYLEGGNLILADGHRPIGRLLGGGANSKVYESSDPTKVKKLVALTRNDVTPDEVIRTMTDQVVGRAILEDTLKARPRSPYRVATRGEDMQLIKANQGGRDYYFVLSRDENIASQVRVEDLSRPDRNTIISVSNAQERIQARTQNNKTLNEVEEMTVNLAIRDLNANGVVWTDHKLANFDIVPDNDSTTGYRMIFFDLDAFRPVQGDNRKQRAEVARMLQIAYDGAANPGDQYNRVTQALQASSNVPAGQDPFDYTAFNNVRPMLYSTPGANQNRNSYRRLNNMGRELFEAEVARFNKDHNKNVQLPPPPR